MWAEVDGLLLGWSHGRQGCVSALGIRTVQKLNDSVDRYQLCKARILFEDDAHALGVKTYRGLLVGYKRLHHAH